MSVAFRKGKEILQMRLFTFSAAGCGLFLDSAKKEKSRRCCRESFNVKDKGNRCECMFCLLSSTLNIQIKKSRLCLVENGKHGKYLHTFRAGCAIKGSRVLSALFIVIVLCSRIKSFPRNL